MNWEQAWLNMKGRVKQLFEQYRLYEQYEVYEEDRIKAGHKADSYENMYHMMLHAEDNEGSVSGYEDEG